MISDLCNAILAAGVSPGFVVRSDGTHTIPEAEIGIAQPLLDSFDFVNGDWLRDTPRAIEQARAEKITALRTDYETMQRQGVTVGEVKLVATEYDQRRLATLLIGINNAIELGAMNAESPVTIWDASGTAHTITVAQYKQMAAAYMAGCIGLEIRLSSAQSRVQQSQTQDEIEAVTL